MRVIHKLHAKCAIYMYISQTSSAGKAYTSCLVQVTWIHSYWGYMYIHAVTFTATWTCTCIDLLDTYMHTQLHEHLHVQIHAHTCTCTATWTCTCSWCMNTNHQELNLPLCKLQREWQQYPCTPARRKTGDKHVNIWSCTIKSVLLHFAGQLALMKNQGSF